MEVLWIKQCLMTILTCLFRSSVMREIWIFFLPMVATIYCFFLVPKLKMLFSITSHAFFVFMLTLLFCTNVLNQKNILFCRLSGALLCFIDAGWEKFPLYVRNPSSFKHAELLDVSPSTRLNQVHLIFFPSPTKLGCVQFDLIIVILCKFWK